MRKCVNLANNTNKWVQFLAMYTYTNWLIGVTYVINLNEPIYVSGTSAIMLCGRVALDEDSDLCKY